MVRGNRSWSIIRQLISCPRFFSMCNKNGINLQHYCVVWGASKKAKSELLRQKKPQRHSLSNRISLAQPVRIITQGRLQWQGFLFLLPSTHCLFEVIPLNKLPTEHCQIFIWRNVSFFGVFSQNSSILNSILLAYLMITCFHFVYVILTGS